MTYKNLVDNLENIITAHKMVHTYGYGEISDINVPDNEEPPNYPYVFVNPESISNGASNFELTVNLIAMTQVGDTEDEELTGQSEMVSIIQDILSTYLSSMDNPLVTFNEPFSINVFKERFSDDVVGATANVTINYGKAIDGCDTPFGPIVPIASGSCPQVLVTDSDLTTHFIDAGGSYTCEPLPDPPSGIQYYDHLALQVSPPEEREGGDGGLYWQYQNGYMPLPTQSLSNPEIRQEIAADNSYDTGEDVNSLLKYNNIFNNKYRFTTTTGKHGLNQGYNANAPYFHGDPDNTEQWGEGEEAAVYGIFIDHLTGQMWTCYSQRLPQATPNGETFTWQGNTYSEFLYQWQDCANYPFGLNGVTQFNKGGYTDWRFPTWRDWLSLCSYDSYQYLGYNGPAAFYWNEYNNIEFYNLTEWENYERPPRVIDNLWTSTGRPNNGDRPYYMGNSITAYVPKDRYYQVCYVRDWKGQTAP